MLIMEVLQKGVFFAILMIIFGITGWEIFNRTKEYNLIRKAKIKKLEKELEKEEN